MLMMLLMMSMMLLRSTNLGLILSLSLLILNELCTRVWDLPWSHENHRPQPSHKSSPPLNLGQIRDCMTAERNEKFRSFRWNNVFSTKQRKLRIFLVFSNFFFFMFFGNSSPVRPWGRRSQSNKWLSVPESQHHVTMFEEILQLESHYI